MYCVLYLYYFVKLILDKLYILLKLLVIYILVIILSNELAIDVRSGCVCK